MKLLITGANGQLGQELSQILESGKSEIGPIDPRYTGCQTTAVDVDRLDITNADAVTAFLREERPDVVINCAAMTNVNACETQVDTAMRVNAIGPRNLARASEEVGAKLIHVSTDYVFDGEGARAGDGTVIPYTEWDRCDPQSVYGKSKWLGEQYVREQCSRAFIVRTAWLYGYVGNNFVKTIWRKALAGDPLKVVDDQVGNPTNANDLAHHLLKIALTEEYGVYHGTGKGICSWYGFAVQILKEAGVEAAIAPCTTAQFPTPAKRPAYSALDHTMLRCTVGDEMRDWKEALAMYVQKLKAQGGLEG